MHSKGTKVIFVPFFSVLHMRQEPCKAYGNLSPAGEDAVQAVDRVFMDWGLSQRAELEGDLLRIAFEGVFFPLDDVLAALKPYLCSDSSGKVDIIDMEGWTLTRAVFTGTEIRLSSAGLNDVLAYSGH